MTTVSQGDAALRPAITDHAQQVVLSCRLCGSSRMSTFIDLNATPPSERFLAVHELDAPEPNYPLHVRICEECLLTQLPALITPEDHSRGHLHRVRVLLFYLHNLGRARGVLRRRRGTPSRSGRRVSSQRDRSCWFDAETFTSFARIRGVQCHARSAEAFHVSQFVLGASSPGVGRG